MTATTTTTTTSDALRRFREGDHAEIRDRVRAVLSGDEFRPAVGLTREEQRARPLAHGRALAAAGLGTLAWPREFGGAGDVAAGAAAWETISQGELASWVKNGIHFGVFSTALQNLGTSMHHERYMAGVASLELPGAILMTERGHGSNVQGLQTTATYDPATQEFVIDTPDESATKDFIGNAARDGRLGIVFARLLVGAADRGIHALIIELRDEDGRVPDRITIEDCGEKLGLNGVDNARVSFDQLRVPREALLDRYAHVSPEGVYTSPIKNANRRFFTMIGALIVGRVNISGASIRVAESALTVATRYANARRQFSAPGADEEELLLDYVTHQRRLLPALAQTYALHFAQDELRAEFARAFADADYSEDDRRKFESWASGMKAIASWHASATIQTCRECCGGAGYIAENRFAALKADSDPFLTFEGDNTVLLQLVAKGLLTGYKDQFGELDPLGMVGFVASQVYETLVERTAARALVGRVVDGITATVGDDERDLLDRGYQLDLLRWREEHQTAGLARRLKRGVDEGGDPYAVFKGCQDHVVTLGRAHVERIVLEAFARAADRCEEPELETILGRLCDLHALATIERDRAWFLEHGRISSPRSKAITRTVNRLCGEVRRDAGMLVEAFGIPENLLGAPIAPRPASDA
jgi:acyl-CoA oxidase